jgi:hypothetical protein
MIVVARNVSRRLAIDKVVAAHTDLLAIGNG